MAGIHQERFSVRQYNALEAIFLKLLKPNHEIVTRCLQLPGPCTAARVESGITYGLPAVSRFFVVMCVD